MLEVSDFHCRFARLICVCQYPFASLALLPMIGQQPNCFCMFAPQRLPQRVTTHQLLGYFASSSAIGWPISQKRELKLGGPSQQRFCMHLEDGADKLRCRLPRWPSLSQGSIEGSQCQLLQMPGCQRR